MPDFDPEKNAKNIEKHGISFVKAARFIPINAVEDTRKDYGEQRWQSYGHIGKEMYFYVFTVRNGRVRAISLRPASQKEKEQYGKAKK
ncbi:MAG TPA: BrnT family toxin [Afipia sp.]|nr:hypothetical protein [Afipia sp.]OUX62462.1 MAG: hypothetical protein CBB64_04345 [Afipia sp. TMED4]HAQ95080.1 BrnT family toxin [Afipia sp.]HBF53318.1 BrnT family toxin [Afipia sp.]HBR46122.1 BrnT family toxin [Afipia sp.]